MPEPLLKFPGLPSDDHEDVDEQLGIHDFVTRTSPRRPGKDRVPLNWERCRAQVQAVRDAMRAFDVEEFDDEREAEAAKADDFDALATRLVLFLDRHRGLRAYVTRERRHGVLSEGWGIIHEVFAYRLVQRYALEKGEDEEGGISDE